MYDGIINVYKEKGFTSHDVVAKMRGILGQRKIGHTGTLDPAAEGVLPVCAGKGTKLCDMLTDYDKTYRAVLLLGTETDTEDTTGTVLEAKDTSGLTEDEVQDVVLSFIGDYAQVPPMYSALKVDGKKLYELAREGKTVERKARPVKIFDIRIEKIELPEVTMTVSCSKGTYIRTLCHDIGAKLSVGGCMKELLRTKVGRFELSESLTLDELQKLKEEDRLAEAVLPVEEVFCQSLKCHSHRKSSKELRDHAKLPEILIGNSGKKVRILIILVFRIGAEADGRRISETFLDNILKIREGTAADKEDIICVDHLHRGHGVLLSCSDRDLHIRTL